MSLSGSPISRCCHQLLRWRSHGCRYAPHKSWITIYIYATKGLVSKGNRCFYSMDKGCSRWTFFSATVSGCWNPLPFFWFTADFQIYNENSSLSSFCCFLVIFIFLRGLCWACLYNLGGKSIAKLDGGQGQIFSSWICHWAQAAKHVHAKHKLCIANGRSMFRKRRD